MTKLYNQHPNRPAGRRFQPLCADGQEAEGERPLDTGGVPGARFQGRPGCHRDAGRMRHGRFRPQH